MIEKWGERNLSQRKQAFKIGWKNWSLISFIILKVNDCMIQLPIIYDK